MQPRFDKDYVAVMIDQDRMSGGAELAKKLREGKSGNGIPWMVILDADGEERVTSDGPKGNCGCPARPHEIDHFMAMIDATRRHMSDDDRAIIERELRAYGADLVGPRRELPGSGAYAEAVRQVGSGSFEAAVEQLGKAFAAGIDPNEILTDPALRPLREDPDRRLELFELAHHHVARSHVAIVDALEPGSRIRLAGRVVDSETGEALSGAVLRLFHTDTSGEYRPGMDAGGGAGNPRLWGYVKTDREGRFTVDTIMPERYTNSTVPRHVHYHVWAEGYPKLVSECFFDADPNLRASTRERAAERGFPIVKLARDAELRQVGELTVRVAKRE